MNREFEVEKYVIPKMLTVKEAAQGCAIAYILRKVTAAVIIRLYRKAMARNCERRHAARCVFHCRIHFFLVAISLYLSR